MYEQRVANPVTMLVILGFVAPVPSHQLDLYAPRDGHRGRQFVHLRSFGICAIFLILGSYTYHGLGLRFRTQPYVPLWRNWATRVGLDFLRPRPAPGGLRDTPPTMPGSAQIAHALIASQGLSRSLLCCGHGNLAGQPALAAFFFGVTAFAKEHALSPGIQISSTLSVFPYFWNVPAAF